MHLVKHRLVLPTLAVAMSLGLLTACSGPGSDSGSSDPPSSPETTTSQPDGSSSEPGDSSSESDADDADVVANPPSKSVQDALAAARDEFSGDVSKIELESQEDGGLEYKVELMSSDAKYAVQYDADTLEKLSDEKDDLGNEAEEKRKKTFDLDSVIDLEKAAEAARDQQDGTITKWKIEGKDTGLVQYEFDIRTDGASDDTEVQINAMDGSVVDDS